MRMRSGARDIVAVLCVEYRVISAPPVAGLNNGKFIEVDMTWRGPILASELGPNNRPVWLGLKVDEG